MKDLLLKYLHLIPQSFCESFPRSPQTFPLRDCDICTYPLRICDIFFPKFFSGIILSVHYISSLKECLGGFQVFETFFQDIESSTPQRQLSKSSNREFFVDFGDLSFFSSFCRCAFLCRSSKDSSRTTLILFVFTSKDSPTITGCFLFGCHFLLRKNFMRLIFIGRFVTSVG
jgi:hypothetical protein